MLSVALVMIQAVVICAISVCLAMAAYHLVNPTPCDQRVYIVAAQSYQASSQVQYLDSRKMFPEMAIDSNGRPFMVSRRFLEDFPQDMTRAVAIQAMESALTTDPE